MAGNGRKIAIYHSLSFPNSLQLRSYRPIYILFSRLCEEAANTFSKGYGKRGLPSYQNTAENLQRIAKSIMGKSRQIDGIENKSRF